MDQKSCISSRGVSFLPQEPKFFDVLNDLWHPETNPGGIVNLGLAENALMHDELTKFFNSKSRADSHALTYGDGFSGSKRLKQAVCHFLNREFKPITPLVPSHLAITPGVGNALECCAWSLLDSGDHILIGRPYWTAFGYIMGIRAGVNLREVSFGKVDPFSLAGVEEYEKEYLRAKKESKDVKAILLCSPNNPLGRCYSEEYELHLVSDEIYGISVWENPEMPDASPFTSVLSIRAEGLMDPRKIHVQWGMNKDFGATGIRIGCLISQFNERFLRSISSFSLFNFPSSLADNVVASLFMDDKFTQEYIALYKLRLAESYRHVTAFLRKHGVPYKKSNASLFVMINLAAVGKGKSMTDDEIVASLREERVYITSGAGYRGEEPGWFRVVIAHPKYVLDEGLQRIMRSW